MSEVRRMNIDTWVELLQLPPRDLTAGRVVGIHRLVDEWGSSAELAAVERGQHERVRNRFIRQAIAQDIRRPSVSLAPLLAELRTSTDPRAAAVEFYSALPSPGRYVRGLADLGRLWVEWWRTPDDPTYRRNLVVVSELVAGVVGRRDVRDLVERRRMTG